MAVARPSLVVEVPFDIVHSSHAAIHDLIDCIIGEIDGLPILIICVRERPLTNTRKKEKTYAAHALVHQLGDNALSVGGDRGGSAAEGISVALLSHHS